MGTLLTVGTSEFVHSPILINVIVATLPRSSMRIRVFLHAQHH